MTRRLRRSTKRGLVHAAFRGLRRAPHYFVGGFLLEFSATAVRAAVLLPSWESLAKDGPQGEYHED